MPGPKAKLPNHELDPLILSKLDLIAQTYAFMERLRTRGDATEEQAFLVLEEVMKRIVEDAGLELPKKRKGRPPSLANVFRRVMVNIQVERGASVSNAAEKVGSISFFTFSPDEAKPELKSGAISEFEKQYYRDRKDAAVIDEYMRFFSNALARYCPPKCPGGNS
jgi:hypothetical protein